MPPFAMGMMRQNPFPAKGWIQASPYTQLFAGKVEYVMLYDTRTANF
jgi:hypothetical protein